MERPASGSHAWVVLPKKRESPYVLKLPGQNFQKSMNGDMKNRSQYP